MCPQKPLPALAALPGSAEHACVQTVIPLQQEIEPGVDVTGGGFELCPVRKAPPQSSGGLL